MATPADAREPTPISGPRRLDLGDLTWADVGDIVWLASAIKPAIKPAGTPAADGPPPADAPADPPAREVPTFDDTDVYLRPTPPERPAAAPEPSGLADERVADPEPELLGHRPELRVLPGDGQRNSRIAPHDSLDFFRALRPLKRRIRSRRSTDVVLNEEATAEQAVETGLWWPVVESRKERWLDLTLVLDSGPTMALWRSRISTFLALLEQLGAFRSIQIRLLDFLHEHGQTIPVLRGGTATAAPRDPAEILDASSRRVVLLLTDGVGDTWRQKILDPVLARWSRTMPVTIVHLLPQWLWRRSGLDLHRATLGARAAVRPNNRWTLRLPEAWLAPDPDRVAPPGAVPVPVIELQPRWLSWWARLIMGESPDVDATVLLAADQVTIEDHSNVQGNDLSAPERVTRFRANASPPAFRLATLLAALPVRLDLAQFVQQEFLAGTGPETLAEVLIWIMYDPGSREGTSTWDTGGELTFPEAVRELLLNGARRSETATVVGVAATHFGARIPVLGHLRAAIADPHNTPDQDLTPESLADVELESAVMRALSGPYLSRADRLRNAILQAGAGSSATELVKSRQTSVSASMSNPAERAEHPAVPVVPTQNRSARAQPPVPDEPVTRPMAHPGASGTRRHPGRQPDDPPPVWGNVPPRNPNFTGRVEPLEQLGRRLTSGPTAVLPSALHGMGGIGKTQMAAEYIYRHLPNYDLVWWLDATHPTQIRAGLTDLARVLNLPGSAETTVAVPAVLEALRTGRPFRRWLLVFDAADSPEDVLPYFPRNGTGEILVTSRNSDWAGVARPLELTVFKREESISLFGKRGPKISNADADELAEKLGDLPLAIEQAAAWRAVTGMPVREYLRLFDESVDEILDAATAPSHEVSVAAAWNVSFDELKKRNPAAHQILHVCAFFSPEPISRELLTGVSRVSISPELDAALRDPIKLARAIRDINRYGLAKIDHGNNTLQLHRLVQLVLRNRVMAPQIHAQMQHGAHQLLASLDPNDPEQGRHWPRYRELLPHAYAANVMDCDDDWPRQLIINIMRFLFECGDHHEAARLGTRIREHFTRTLGPTHPQTLDVSSRLGLYLWSIGRYEQAAELNQRTLALRLQVSGEENEETFALQRSIVIDQRAQGEFAAGAKLSEEIYLKTKRMFGEDDPETLNAAFQHGLSLRLLGEYLAAAELDEDTYRRRVEVLGPDHPRTSGARSAVTIDRREAGEYGQARVMQENHTEQFKARYGESPDAIAMDFLLAINRRKDGDHTGALALSTDALQRFRLRRGDEHAHTMACALTHSIDLRHSGDLAAAKELGEQTFGAYRRSLGEHHPHTLAATVNLAVTLRLRGDIAEARVLDERALEHFRAGIGPNHPNAIITMINLASELSALGELDKAIELGRDAIVRGGPVLGTDHPTMLAAEFNLGLDLDAAGHAEQARPYRDPVLTKYRRVLGEAHPGTQAAVRGTRADCDIDVIMM
ncbi:FxSxx-COOH system tetratricopeptide repeat protein [Actinophytocola sediminis]